MGIFDFLFGKKEDTEPANEDRRFEKLLTKEDFADVRLYKVLRDDVIEDDDGERELTLGLIKNLRIIKLREGCIEDLSGIEVLAALEGLNTWTSARTG